MNDTNETARLIIQSKSMAVAIILALLFGPLGMFYSTVPGALIMLVVSLVVGVVTFGVGLLVVLPICALWAGVAVSNHNKRLLGL